MAEKSKPPNKPKSSHPTASANGFVQRLIKGTAKSHRQVATEHIEAAFAPGEEIPSPPTAHKPVRIACMITHGMGQQVPFETAATTAAAFVRGRKPKTIQANRVALVSGGELVARMELCYEETSSEPETHVHIYEAYWAPLTEGKITYKAIASFLLTTGAEGIKTTIRNNFDRWIFGALRKLPIKRHTLVYLLITMAVVLILIGLIAVSPLALNYLWTTVKGYASLGPRTALGHILGDLWHHPWVVISLLALFWIGSKLRLILVQYLGDVIIYVSSHKVSGYEETRTAIQKIAIDLGKQIVSATDPISPIYEAGAHTVKAKPTFVYDGILFAGHSLGSVITYDLINALITWDADGCGGRHDLTHRITRFLTFGSPLDKTAFLFRTQTSKQTEPFRELMAGNMQAMILSYKLRPFPWINLHSHLDPVSGELAYYDLPEPAPIPAGATRVKNIIDTSAWLPVYAHTQYWNSTLLSEHLLEGVGLRMHDEAPAKRSSIMKTPGREKVRRAKRTAAKDAS
jgi:hypothetical protein